VNAIRLQEYNSTGISKMQGIFKQGKHSILFCKFWSSGTAMVPSSGCHN